MTFEFATASRIIFGQGTLKEVAPLASEMGRTAILITGRNTERARPLLKSLAEADVEAVILSVPGEPTLETIIEGTKTARENVCDMVVGMGGGSAIDAAKAVAALLTNRGDLMDYLEVIGAGKSLTEPPAPCIAVPTTAGTGAEVTRNAVLTSTRYKVKVSLRSPLMLPDLAVVDPELTYSMPPSLTASTGLDALTQLLESFVSVKSNPLTDGLCREGMKRAARSLRRAFENGTDKAAREDMAIASLFGGLALANARLGAVHGFAGPVGGMFPAPHGVVCARLLPFVAEANVKALRERGSRDSLARYDEVGRILTGQPDAAAEDGISWLQGLCETLNVPRLAESGVTESDFPALVASARKASSTRGNPIELTEQELTEILAEAV
jgi:alcohol dehydrogenase class IV